MKEAYTYWSAGELRRLQQMASSNMPTRDIAIAFDRSEGAIKARLYYLRIARLATVTDPTATLQSLRRSNG